MDRTYLSNWLFWAIVFFIGSIASGMLGFGYISGVSYTIARGLAMIFLILFMIAVIAHTIKNA